MNATTCESLSGADRLILAGDVNVGQGIHPHTIDIQPGTVSNRLDIQHSEKKKTQFLIMTGPLFHLYRDGQLWKKTDSKLMVSLYM